jgi:hypothetical protein
MKTIAIIICALGLTMSASAQRVIHAAPHYYPRTHVAVGVGLGYGYGYYPYWGYNPFWGYPPYYGYGYYNRPTKLDLEIQDIRNDYKDKIWSARHDTSIPRRDRRQKVHELKHERDQAITDAKRSYYKR